jgi:hypothetical protein
LAVLFAAMAVAAPLLYAAPASAGISSSEKALLRGVALQEAAARQIKHPGIQVIKTTYAAYSKAFPGSPKLHLGSIYVVQIIGSYASGGRTFSALELLFNASTSSEAAAIQSKIVKNLSKLGSVSRL